MMSKAIDSKARTGPSSRSSSQKAGKPKHKKSIKSKEQTKRMSPAATAIVKSLQQAIESLDGGPPLTVRTYRFDFPLPEYGPDDVRRARALFGMSQTIFAQFLGVDTNTVQSWEQGARPTSNLARRFLGEIESDPEYWREKIEGCIVAAGTEHEKNRNSALEA
jgi:putative transcriptional regulator